MSVVATVLLITKTVLLILITKREREAEGGGGGGGAAWTRSIRALNPEHAGTFFKNEPACPNGN